MKSHSYFEGRTASPESLTSVLEEEDEREPTGLGSETATIKDSLGFSAWDKLRGAPSSDEPGQRRTSQDDSSPTDSDRGIESCLASTSSTHRYSTLQHSRHALEGLDQSQAMDSASRRTLTHKRPFSDQRDSSANDLDAWQNTPSSHPRYIQAQIRSGSHQSQTDMPTAPIPFPRLDVNSTSDEVEEDEDDLNLSLIASRHRLHLARPRLRDLTAALDVYDTSPERTRRSLAEYIDRSLSGLQDELGRFDTAHRRTLSLRSDRVATMSSEMGDKKRERERAASTGTVGHGGGGGGGWRSWAGRISPWASPQTQNRPSRECNIAARSDDNWGSESEGGLHVEVERTQAKTKVISLTEKQFIRRTRPRVPARKTPSRKNWNRTAFLPGAFPDDFEVEVLDTESEIDENGEADRVGMEDVEGMQEEVSNQQAADRGGIALHPIDTHSTHEDPHITTRLQTETEETQSRDHEPESQSHLPPRGSPGVGPRPRSPAGVSIRPLINPWPDPAGASWELERGAMALRELQDGVSAVLRRSGPFEEGVDEEEEDEDEDEEGSSSSHESSLESGSESESVDEGGRQDGEASDESEADSESESGSSSDNDNDSKVGEGRGEGHQA